MTHAILAEAGTGIGATLVAKTNAAMTNVTPATTTTTIVEVAATTIRTAIAAHSPLGVETSRTIIVIQQLTGCTINPVGTNVTQWITPSFLRSSARGSREETKQNFNDLLDV